MPAPPHVRALVQQVRTSIPLPAEQELPSHGCTVAFAAAPQCSLSQLCQQPDPPFSCAGTQGKLESKAENFEAAEAFYREALRLCETQFGKGAVETGSPLFVSLASLCTAGTHALSLHCTVPSLCCTVLFLRCTCPRIASHSANALHTAQAS